MSDLIKVVLTKQAKIVLILLIIFPSLLLAQLFEKGSEYKLTSGIAITLPQSNKNTIFAIDPVEAAMVTNSFKQPKVGETVFFNETEYAKWIQAKTNEKGWYWSKHHGSGEYVYFNVESQKEQAVLLEGMLHQMVYVNGEPRVGNRYQYKETFESWEPGFNYSLIPVNLKKGINHLLFRCNRGGLKVKLHKVKKSVQFNIKDRTFPDLLIGETVSNWAAVVVINASDKPLKNASIVADEKSGLFINSEIPDIMPWSVRKVGFKIEGAAPKKTGKLELNLKIFQIMDGKKVLHDTAGYGLEIKNSNETHRRTFIREIDGSVQYYAVNEANGTKGESKALFLSMHGASVEAWNQANAYWPKKWGHIVSPTNRRPYGYNWEDWGRLDALEVLDIAHKKCNIDPSQTYLTGHSMGGYGTWIFGATYPDKFAAIGPSAGWISFWTYRWREEIKMDSPFTKMMMRTGNPSNTFALAANYKKQGIYILHGKDDDNVRVEQSYLMIDRLKELNKNYIFHEEQDAGHWWDKSNSKGADCVDWPPLFDFFAGHRIAQNDQTRDVEFITFNPGVSAWNHWAGIIAQEKQLAESRIKLHYDPGSNHFSGSTKNVKRLALDVGWLDKGEEITVSIDSSKSLNTTVSDSKIYFEKSDTQWRLIKNLPMYEKGPHRYGTFKSAFNNNMIFVVGSQGSDKENEWALAKARYDAETFWYQGNGSIDIVLDKDFDEKADLNRSIIIYGNAQTNSVWNKLLKDSPVQVKTGIITIGEKEIKGSDLAALFVRPRPGSDKANIAVIAGTGIEGMRLTDRRPYTYAGYSYPDCMVLDSNFLIKGSAGVKAAGFFGLDWSMQSSEFIFADDKHTK